MRQLTDCVQGIDNVQSALIKTHSNSLLKQTSTILSIVSKTPDTIADLKATTIIHAKKQSEQAQMLEHGLTGVVSHVSSLSRVCLGISGALSLHTAAMKRCAKRLFRLMQDIKELFVL